MLVTVTVHKPTKDTDLGLGLKTSFKTIRITSGEPNGLCAGKGLRVGDEIIALNGSIPRPGVARTIDGDLTIAVFRGFECRKELMAEALGGRYDLSWPENNKCVLDVPSRAEREGLPDVNSVAKYAIRWHHEGRMGFSIEPTNSFLTGSVGDRYTGETAVKLYTREEIELSMTVSLVNSQVAVEKTKALIEATRTSTQSHDDGTWHDAQDGAWHI